MTTKPSQLGVDRGIFSSPFDAFTNYMNILGDFISRVNSLYPEDVDNEQLSSLLTTIKNQDDEIEMKTKEIVRLQTKIEKIEAAEVKLREKLEKAKTAKAKTTTAAKTPRKTATKKTTSAKEAVEDQNK